MSLSMSVGILVAPLLCGVAYDRAGYYAVYYMAFGLLALDIFLRLALIEGKIARQWVVNEASLTDSEASDTSDNEKEKKHRDEGISQPTGRVSPVLSLLASPRLLTALWGFVVQGAMMTAFDSV
jgi:hypothetical protein